MRRLLWLLWLLAASPALAVPYYVDGVNGVDQAGCGAASGASACRTISRVITDRALVGGDVVNVAPTTYYETVTIGNADDGSSAASMVVFQATAPGVVISGLDATVLNDAAAVNCIGGACGGTNYPNVWRFDATGRTVLDVVETVWDRTVRSTNVNGADFTFKAPVFYTNVTDLASVNNLPGSWLLSGTDLYVHTFDSVAPTAVNVETVARTRGLRVAGSEANPASWIRVQGIAVRYAQTNVELFASADVTLEDVVAESAGGTGVLVNQSNRSRLTSVVSRSVYRRGSSFATVATPQPKGAGYTNTSGQGGSGNCISVITSGGSGPVTTGHVWTDVDAAECYNAVSTEQMQAFAFDKIYAHNASNHSWILNSFPASVCTDGIVTRSIAVNAQEGIYNFCQNVRWIKNAANFATLEENGKTPGSGNRWLSNLTDSQTFTGGTFNVCENCKPGFFSDWNWLAANSSRCFWAPTNYPCRDDGVGDDWQDASGGDLNSHTSTNTVQLKGVLWPRLAVQGIAYDDLTWEDFCVDAGSELIDAGSQDLNGDGVVNAADACTLANGCYGTRPDVGPCEYGIDVTVQYARPDLDQTLGGWTDNAGGTGNIYLMISEITPEDGSYIEALGDGGGTTSRFRLSNVSDPGVDTGHVMRWRARRVSGSGLGGSIAVRLYQGTTQIASKTTSLSTLATWIGDELALSTAQAGAISDYTNLFVEFTNTPGIGLWTVQASWYELEVPVAPPAPADTTPPNAVTDLAVESCTETSCVVGWTAPGDDGTSGTSTSYDLRFIAGTAGCPELDTDGEWNARPNTPGEPTPSVSGTHETMTISGLTSGTRYCFALKASDEIPNTSALSNRAEDVTDTPAGGGTDVACNEGAIRTAIADACAGTRPSTITFACAAVTITVTSNLDLPASCPSGPLTIDGGSKGIWFENSPPWWDRNYCSTCDGGTAVGEYCTGDGDCPGSTCTIRNCDNAPDDGIPDACSESNGDDRFMTIRHNGATVKGFGIRYWNNGISPDGTGLTTGVNSVTVENIACDLPGDECFANEEGAGPNNVFRNVSVSRACDKGMQLYGKNPTSAPGAGVDAIVENATFLNCNQPILMSGAGRFSVTGSTFDTDADGGTLWRCDGPQADGTGVILTWTNNTVTNCRRGLRIGGTSQARVVGGLFESNELRGLAVYGSGRISVQGATIQNNGGTSSSETRYGGISVSGTALADLGGGSIVFDGVTVVSAGGNRFSNNSSPSDPTLNVENQIAGYTVKAEAACWNDTDPGDEVGPNQVDWDPLDASCAGPQPTNIILRRGFRGAGVRMP